MAEDKPDLSKVDMTVYSDELVACIKNGTPIKTSAAEFAREYRRQSIERSKILDKILGITRDEN